MTESDQTAQGRKWFRFACAFEGALVGAGIILARALGVPGLGALRWRWPDVAWGGLAITPLLLMLLWLTRSHIGRIREITQFLDTTVTPSLRHWSLLQVAVVSILAGLGEELVFRAALQTAFQGWLGLPVSLLLSNLLFGLCHWVTPAYALVAAVVGAYLGLLFFWSGNLLVPALAHALYDLVALIYFLRVRAAVLR